MAESTPPYWALLSVLFSTFPLTPPVAMALLAVAQELHRTQGGELPVAGDVLSGRVRNLRKEFLVGTLGGPAFEAELETERGHGTVRFLLTRQALEHMAEGVGTAPAVSRPQYLN